MLHVIVHFLAMKPVQCPASRAALNSGPLLLASRKPLKVRQTTPRNGCLAVACKLLLDKYPKSLPLILAKQTGCSAPGSKLNFVALTCSWLFSLWLEIQATALSSMRVVVDSRTLWYLRGSAMGSNILTDQYLLSMVPAVNRGFSSLIFQQKGECFPYEHRNPKPYPRRRCRRQNTC